MAQRLTQLEEPWMVFGGAAVALHGIDCGPIKDIDVVLPHRAALRLSAMFSWKNHADERSDRFRSDVLLRPDLGPVPVELLGGFQVRGKSGWVAVDCSETQGIQVGAQRVFVPSLERLANIFRLCGREKDIRRAKLIERR
ncbi:hypothetical protein [Pelagibacterium lentulum]|nr:hypothetical protein [Pelagibacterium lentulum]